MARIVSLGQFVVDTFRYLDADGKETGEAKPDIIGGGATYFIIGARAFLPPSALGQLIDRDASCFPAEFESQLAVYGRDMFEYRERTDGVAYSRACNTYRGDVRGFEFLTPFIRLFPADFARTRLFRPMPAALHMANRVEHARETVQQVDEIAREWQNDLGEELWDPEIFWEPFPATCIPENGPAIRTLAPRIAVLSPNHIEALSLLGLAPGALDRSAAESGLDADDPLHRGTEREGRVRGMVESAARAMGGWGVRRGVVVRCGGLGACVARRREAAPAGPGREASPSPSKSAPVHLTWIPAYHQPISTPSDPRPHPAIRDVTGGGNAFLGGLAAGLRSGLSLERAAVWGSVAASLAIEQDGLPRLSKEDGEERWNGTRVVDRVRELEARMGEESGGEDGGSGGR